MARIGLALSGGGIRGVAHIGALKALEEKNIVADIVSGTSAGSIIGALYTMGFKSEEMLSFVKTFQLYKIIRLSWPMKGFASLAYLIKKLRAIEPTVCYENSNIPLKVTMTNLNSGKLKVGEQGDLLKNVAASCAIPMLFEPILIDEELYVDGGVVKNLPASIIRDHCDLLIGINVMPSLEVNTENMRSLLSIMGRTFEMSVWRNQEDDIPLCDLHVEVPNLHNFSLFSLSQMDEIYQRGYNAMKAQIPALLQMIKDSERTVLS